MSYEEAHEVEDPENPDYENYYADLDVLSLDFARSGNLCWLNEFLHNL